MYKLIAIDLDGTLLNSYSEISKENKTALQMAKQKGAEIVLASRKNFKFYRKYSKRIRSGPLSYFGKWCSCL